MNGLLFKKKINWWKLTNYLLKECSFNVFSEHMSVVSSKPDFYKLYFAIAFEVKRVLHLTNCKKQHRNYSG